jgi:hypothetical protein
MKQRLHLHSIVEAITNSSTEIYTFANDNAISMAKKAINKILQAAGVTDRKAEDLFDISARITYDKFDSDTEDTKQINAVARTDNEIRKINADITEEISNDGSASPDVHLIVTSKNGKELDLVELFTSVIHQEECNR